MNDDKNNDSCQKSEQHAMTFDNEVPTEKHQKHHRKDRGADHIKTQGELRYIKSHY